MFLLGLLFNKPSCLNRRSHTAPGIAEVNLLTANQAINETQRLRFAIIVSPLTSL